MIKEALQNILFYIIFELLIFFIGLYTGLIVVAAAAILALVVLIIVEIIELTIKKRKTK